MASLLNMSGGSLLNKSLPYDAEIEYLSSVVPANEAYIDTGINYNSSYIYEISFATGNYYNTIWGARRTTDYTAKGNHTITYITHGNTCMYASTANSTELAFFPYSNNQHTILYQQSKRVLLYDGISYWKGGWITEDSVPLNVFLFCYNNAGNPSTIRTSYLKIYAYKVKDKDGKLIQDLIPVRVGTTGYMYDKVSGQLFGNSGTGNFILGNDI